MVVIKVVKNKLLKLKTEQPSDLPQDEVISKFSYSSGDGLNSSKNRVLNVKTKTDFKEHLQQIELRLESTSDINTCVNTCYGSLFSGYGVLRKEDSLKEVTKPNSDVCGETNFNENNLKEFNIYQDGGKPYNQVICGQDFGTVDTIIQQKKIHTGEKSYTYVVCGRTFKRNSPIKEHALGRQFIVV
ncbi:zinc finger protein 16-like [Limulus polyphemus]|uniref:Zinc finger protein 16-like n=1 Tax=Limulus polyphemus TaxID=6850 RepID=A0ABM1RVK7_LIMPO|nr:zinc finger protein 16-like [Limulus polyphemus]